MIFTLFLKRISQIDVASSTSLDKEFDFILIEGAGGIAVPIDEGTDDFYMTKGLINDCADCVISVLPSKLAAISDAVVHQD